MTSERIRRVEGLDAGLKHLTYKKVILSTGEPRIEPVTSPLHGSWNL